MSPFVFGGEDKAKTVRASLAGGAERHRLFRRWLRTPVLFGGCASDGSPPLITQLQHYRKASRSRLAMAGQELRPLASALIAHQVAQDNGPFRLHMYPPNGVASHSQLILFGTRSYLRSHHRLLLRSYSITLYTTLHGHPGSHSE